MRSQVQERCRFVLSCSSRFVDDAVMQPAAQVRTADPRPASSRDKILEGHGGVAVARNSVVSAAAMLVHIVG